MTAQRIAAMLLLANAVVMVIGALGGGAPIERPAWLPSIWTRAAIPLLVAGGLWLGHRWAWWLAVAMCAGLLLLAGVAAFMLALGGFFTGAGAIWRIVYVGVLAVTWLTTLALLLSPSGRMVGRPMGMGSI